MWVYAPSHCALDHVAHSYPCFPKQAYPVKHRSGCWVTYIHVSVHGSLHNCSNRTNVRKKKKSQMWKKEQSLGLSKFPALRSEALLRIIKTPWFLPSFLLAFYLSIFLSFFSALSSFLPFFLSLSALSVSCLSSSISLVLLCFFSVCTVVSHTKENSFE